MTLKPAPTGARLNAGRSGFGQRAAAASRGGSNQGRRVSAVSSLLTETIHLRRRQIVHVALLGSAAVCSQPAVVLAAALDGFQVEEGGEEPMAEPGESASGSGDQKGGRGRLNDKGELIPEEEVASGSERGDSDVDSDSASDSSDSESGSDSESDSDSDDEEERQEMGPSKQQEDKKEQKQRERQKAEQEERGQEAELGEEEKRLQKEEKRQRKQQRKREQEEAAAAPTQPPLEAEGGPGSGGGQEVQPNDGVTAQQGGVQRDVLHHWPNASGAEPAGLLTELLL